MPDPWARIRPACFGKFGRWKRVQTLHTETLYCAACASLEKGTVLVILAILTPKCARA
jgi:hypothetical protein